MCRWTTARLSGRAKDISELASLRNPWVPDAERIVDEAKRLGLLGDDLDDEGDDFDEEEFDDEDDYRA